MLYDFAIKRVISVVGMCMSALVCLGSQVALERFGVSDGLSHYSINAFYQDEYGRMWVATRDGLNCIAGNSCRIFRGDEATGLPIRNNYIHTVCGDGEGKLLFRSGGSVLKMSLKTEELTIVDSMGAQAVVYGQGRFLIAARDTLFAYQRGEKKPLLTIHQPTAVYEWGEQIIVSNKEGVRVYNTAGRLLQQIGIPSVVQIIRDSRQNLWLCSRTDGLWCIQPTGDKKHVIEQTDVRAIAEDHTGNYWVGTYSGLVRVAASDFSCHAFTHNDSEEYPFSVRAIVCDEQGTLWIGSFFGAIDLYNPRHAVYTYYGADKTKGEALSYPIVNRIVSDSAGSVYVGTNGGGLNKIDASGKIRTIHISKSRPEQAIKALYLDEKRHRLYMGTHQGGLIEMDTRTERLRAHTTETGEVADNRVREIVAYGDSLFFSTERGIGLLNRATGQFECLPQADVAGELSHLYLQDSVLWFARQRMTYAYHIRTGAMETYTIAKPVHVFASDKEGHLIAGTIDGVLRFSAEKGEWEADERLNACLDSRSVIDILPTKGYYMIATAMGLTIASDDMSNARHLNSKNGFPIEILTEQSLYQDPKGRVFVGGVDGMCSFYVEDIMQRGEPMHVFPTEIVIRDSRGEIRHLNAGLPMADTLYLQPDEKVVSIRFGSSSYSNILRPQLYYQLEGFDNERVAATEAQSATYTNLEPGEYDFELTDDIGDLYRLHLIVEPHWYETWWAKVLFFSIVAAGIIALGWYILRVSMRKTKERLAEQERQIEQKNEQLRQMRERLQNERVLFVAQVQAVIEKHLNDADFDINRLAREMCMSRTGLYTKLQDAMGKTPNELIQEIRLKKAAELLKEAPEKSVAEIADMVGYNTASYFIKCFNKQYGQTPAAYRKGGYGEKH